MYTEDYLDQDYLRLAALLLERTSGRGRRMSTLRLLVSASLRTPPLYTPLLGECKDTAISKSNNAHDKRVHPPETYSSANNTLRSTPCPTKEGDCCGA